MSEVLGVFGATLLGFTLLQPGAPAVHQPDHRLLPGAGAGHGDPGNRTRCPGRPASTSDGIFAGGLGVDVAYQGVHHRGHHAGSSYILGHCMEAGSWEMPRGSSARTA